MPSDTVIGYRETEGVKSSVIEHDPAFTAQEVAAAAHITGRQVAKTVMLQFDEDLAMAILPATHRVSDARIKEHTGAENVPLATERVFMDVLRDCEFGALPPFGNLYGIRVFADEALTGQLELAICGGSHDELIRLSFSDFERLAKPAILDFAFVEA